ncbi:hypothetical protein K2173_028031 [Erythroxylum novogranatense]|uniref:BHLH domain-containing protein n=1 Tax=Erythroxylum novogranatense TaxID=1862640 RepID=A0AAV8U3P7_9ROSI|nr:hypothetical protein K2173_028031 [Erythroxylum novogranatense]
MDLYGTSSSPATSEPEEISSFLHHLLHIPSSSSKFTQNVFSSPPSPPPESSDQHLSGPDFRSSVANLSNTGGKGSVDNAECCVSSKGRGVCVENDGTERSELPFDTMRPRNSSKRSRTAEVHNLSEKRRRSRINEKMKALQTLIPNANKTDKASMLDEAIEYLKQLQLQVQMLTMRNGLSLHPMCLPGVAQPMQLPLSGLGFEEGNILLNANSNTGAFSANEERSIHSSHKLPSQCTISNQPVVGHSRATSFDFDPLIQVQHGTFEISGSSKELCGEGTTTYLDVNQTLKTSSSTMS